MCEVGNVPDTADWNHYRCCAIAEILCSRSTPRNIKIFKKVGDNYVIAANEHFVKKIYYLVYDRNHIYCIFLLR